MKINLDASIENISFLEYMKEQERKARESKEDQKNSWSRQIAPQEEKKEQYRQIPKMQPPFLQWLQLCLDKTDIMAAKQAAYFIQVVTLNSNE